MIKEFVPIWNENNYKIKEKFSKKHPEDYSEIVHDVVKLLPKLDSKKITELDHGDYQGTLVYIIPENQYQPDIYYIIGVGYGSCSSCDTFESIREENYTSEIPTESQSKQYWTLALHIFQSIRKIDFTEDR